MWYWFILGQVSQNDINVMSFTPRFDFYMTPANASRCCSKMSRGKATTSFVTVITASKNDDEYPSYYLRETILSVQRQTFAPFITHIISIQGKVLQEYSKFEESYDNVFVVKCSEKGVSAARNCPFKKKYVQTPYVVFLDDDDLIEKTHIEKLYFFADTHPNYGLVNTFEVAFQAKNYLWSRTLMNDFRYENHVITSGMFLRTSVLLEYAPSGEIFDESLQSAEDWALWIALKNMNCLGFTVPEYLVWFREKKKRRDWSYLSGKQDKTFYSPRLFKRIYKRFYNKESHLDAKDEPMFKTAPFSLSSSSMKEKPTTKTVILLIPWLAVGGADELNVEIVRILTLNGYHVIVVCTLSTAIQDISNVSPSLSWQTKRIMRYTEDIFVLPHFIHESSYVPFVNSLVYRYNVRVVFLSNSLAGYCMLPFIENVPIVDLVHMDEDFKVDCGYTKSLQHGYLGISSHQKQYISHTFVIFSKLKEMYSNHNISVLYPTDFSTPEAIARKKPTNIRILFSGRLESQKNPIAALRIFKTALHKSETNDISLTVIGMGSMETLMKSYVLENNLRNHVTFVSDTSKSNILAAMRTHDILLQPSVGEGISIMAIEAMNRGMIPLTFDVGGQKELVRDLVCQSEESMSARILELRTCTTNEYDQLQSKIKEYVTPFLPLYFEQSLMQVVNNVAHSRAPLPDNIDIKLYELTRSLVDYNYYQTLGLDRLIKAEIKQGKLKNQISMQNSLSKHA